MTPDKAKWVAGALLVVAYYRPYIIGGWGGWPLYIAVVAMAALALADLRVIALQSMDRLVAGAFALILLGIGLSEFRVDADSEMYDPFVGWNIVGGFCLFVLARSERTRRAFIAMVMLAGSIAGALAIERYLQDPTMALSDAGILYRDPNYLGLVVGLSATIAMGMALAQGTRTVTARLIWFGVGAIAWAVIGLLASRGSLVAVSLGLVTMVATALTGKRFRGRAMVRVVAATALALGLFAYNEATSWLDFSRMASRSRASIEQGDISGRELAFAASWDLIRTQSIGETLVGRGSGMGMVAVGRLYNLPAFDSHNALLTIGLEYGVLGVLGVVVLFGTAFARSWRARASDAGQVRLGLWVALATGSMGLSTLRYGFAWCVLGLLLSRAGEWRNREAVGALGHEAEPAPENVTATRE